MAVKKKSYKRKQVPKKLTRKKEDPKLWVVSLTQKEGYDFYLKIFKSERKYHEAQDTIYYSGGSITNLVASRIPMPKPTTRRYYRDFGKLLCDFIVEASDLEEQVDIEFTGTLATATGDKYITKQEQQALDTFLDMREGLAWHKKMCKSGVKRIY